MNLKLTLASGCLALSLASIAAAENPTMQFACDTPAGHYSSWSQSISAHGLEIEGKLKVNELRKDKKWIPAAHIIVRAGQEDKSAYGISIFALAKQPDVLFTQIVGDGDPEPIGPLGGMLPRTSEPIAFKLKLDATGALTVNVGGGESTARIGAIKASTLELNCSTVDIEFIDVRLTTID